MVEGDLYIRGAIENDASLLSEISTETFLDTFTGTCSKEDIQGFVKTFFNPAQISDELRDINDFYFIAFISDQPVGYIRMKEEKNEIRGLEQYKAIELKRIYVLKNYHSKKIGAKLMTFALNFASEKNYEVIWLGVWEHNEKAKSFYEKFGFIDSGATHPFPIGNTPQTDLWLYKFIAKEPVKYICP